VCKIKSQEFGVYVETLFEQLPTDNILATTCKYENISGTGINSDPMVQSIGKCNNEARNEKIKLIRFDGTNSCDDTAVAINLRYGYDLEEMDEMCRVNKGNER
jgi:hypothetical protein